MVVIKNEGPFIIGQNGDVACVIIVMKVRAAEHKVAVKRVWADALGAYHSSPSKR